MKLSLAALGAFVAAISNHVGAQPCAAGTAQEIKGNWYCEAVKAVSYTNFGSSGTYEQITSMDGGVCLSAPEPFSGPMAPLDKEVCFSPHVVFCDGTSDFEHRSRGISVALSHSSNSHFILLTPATPSAKSDQVLMLVVIDIKTSMLAERKPPNNRKITIFWTSVPSVTWLPQPFSAQP